ncbi:Nalcn [Acrasis kona]|uniref:Nalcn n=1 Tax=Acrasis kona TaxID=1008807 RepID=A0AAW2Z3M2_9EUKA
MTHHTFSPGKNSPHGKSLKRTSPNEISRVHPSSIDKTKHLTNEDYKLKFGMTLESNKTLLKELSLHKKNTTSEFKTIRDEVALMREENIKLSEAHANLCKYITTQEITNIKELQERQEVMDLKRKIAESEMLRCEKDKEIQQLSQQLLIMERRCEVVKQNNHLQTIEHEVTKNQLEELKAEKQITSDMLEYYSLIAKSPIVIIRSRIDQQDEQEQTDEFLKKCDIFQYTKDGCVITFALGTNEQDYDYRLISCQNLPKGHKLNTALNSDCNFAKDTLSGFLNCVINKTFTSHTVTNKTTRRKTK